MYKLELNKMYEYKILEGEGEGNELTDSSIEGSKWDLAEARGYKNRY